ncbi:methyl-accepting chemotaxis protein [Massilia endophytica]|uniref:methyl-accepting chemotaxis protein n=1 Tax=Massilia endophytica TaxID=2899220 RepID=UPI001E532A78|nr:methyl-accepting chemotaxis protein [Massilia endophytica]UGQ44824.1 methyl-accepting chemotaxis protein [Massilia endophytica]
MKNLRIGMRLGLGFAVVLALLAVLTAAGVTRMQSASRMTEVLVTERVHNERLMAEWNKIIEVNAARAGAAILAADPAEQKAIEDSMGQSSKRATEIQDLLGKTLADERSRREHAAVLDARKAYIAVRKTVLKAKLDGNIEESRRLFQGDMEARKSTYLAALATLLKTQQDLLDEMATDIQSNYESGRNMLVALGICALAMGVLFAWWITRTITQPIHEAVRVAETVSAGDLTSEIPVGGKDETGQLMSALKNMNSNLVTIVGQVRSGTDTIATASSEIAAGNLDLSTRTEEQASSLQQTASSMEELTSTVRINADNARQAKHLAVDAADIASRGGSVVSEVVTTMGSINESSRKIVDIISVIDGIAFQTNILALNAAVEAARAGEQGRGFAVVASEVRNLAQRSASAAKEIKALIDDSVQKVEAGSTLVDRAGSTMGEIVQAISRVTEIMTQIADASEEQQMGIEQVNLAITQMDEVTQQNAALVEEAAAAAASMQDQSARLAEAVSLFRLDVAQIASGAGRAPRARPMLRSVPKTRQQEALEEF